MGYLDQFTSIQSKFQHTGILQVNNSFSLA